MYGRVGEWESGRVGEWESGSVEGTVHLMGEVQGSSHQMRDCIVPLPFFTGPRVPDLESEGRHGACLIQWAVQFVEVAHAPLKDGLEGTHIFGMDGEIHTICKCQIGVERPQLG